MKNLVLLSGLSLLFSHICLAQNVEDGITAYQKADYKKALEVFQPLADIDFNYTQLRSSENNPVSNPLAQYYLGLIYCMGQGVDANKETAEEWFKKSRRNGIHRSVPADCQ